MEFKIGNLSYVTEDIIIPGDVMRDQGLDNLNDAYHMLERFREDCKVDTVYIYPCGVCGNEVIYKTISSMPETCEYCENTDFIFKETYVAYIVL